MLRTTKAEYDVHARTSAVSAGGLGLIHELIRHFGLARAIDESVHVLARHSPYHESDHVLTLTYNLLAGGSCIEDLELRRNDAAFLDMLGAQRIPDPTTAGDFCRRFTTKESIDGLQHALNESRLRIWSEQPESFRDHAILDADGTIAATTGEKKEGMDLSHKGVWGYQVLDFFYITNKRDLCPKEVVEFANLRCNQERLIDQLKNEVHALRMPLDTLHANWAYAVIATLAWNLSRWVGLLLPETGRWAERHAAEKNDVRRMCFDTFVQAFILIPAQVVSTARRLVLRLLAWNPWQLVFFRALDAVRRLA